MIEKVRDLRIPIDPATVTDSLAPTDPVRAALARHIRNAINARLGAAWAKVVATFPAGHLLRGTKPVQDVVELEPNPTVLGARKPAYPLLAVYREQATIARQSIQLERVDQDWCIDYLLGPLAPDDVRKVGDACRLAALTTIALLRDGFGYDETGAKTPAFAIPATAVRVTEVIGPAWAALEGLPAPFYAVTIKVQTSEVMEQLPDPAEVSDFSGLDLTAALGKPPDQIDAFIVDKSGLP